MKTKMPVHTSTRTHARRGSILVAAATLLLVASCRPRAAQEPVIEISADTAATQPVAAEERVAKITKQLSRNGRLPSVLLDAQFLEEKVGDDVLGPADFSAFYALTVSVADLPAWRSALAASPVLNAPAHYAAPKAPTSWWLKPVEFGKLELFGSRLLTGRVNGWAGLAPDGRIFICAFTM